MAQIPESIISEWKKMDGPAVLTTVDKLGIPNAIYATCVSLYGREYAVVADNYFSKTGENIQSGSRGSLLFITSDKKSYQIKGPIEYYREGPIFDDMKKWNPAKHPGRGAAAIKVDEIYSGSEKIL